MPSLPRARLPASLPTLLALHGHPARLRTGGVQCCTAWPATAARLRERDAARLNIGPRQPARARRAGLRGTDRRVRPTAGCAPRRVPLPA